MALLLATPRLIRAGIRARRLRPRDPGSALPLGWRELLDLGTDYGLAPGPSETPRAYSARLRGGLLGDAGGLDQAAHQAVVALTAGFERHSYGPPSGALPEGAADGGQPGSARSTVAAQVAAVESSLQANAGLARRLQAAWLPPSVMGRLGRLLAAPFLATGRILRRTAKAAAHSRLGLSRQGARDGVRRQSGS